MTTTVGVHEAKTNLSQLLRRVAEGEEIIITNGGVPAARLLPMHQPAAKRIGLFRGRITMAADFDDLPDEFAEHFRP
jgi:prevent-host-death family protein